MLAPLSGKLKMKMMLDQAKSQADEQRKQEKHDLALDAQAKKANLGFQFATRDQIIKEKAKLRDLELTPSPVPPLNPIPEMESEYETPTNPEAGASDTVPTMLTAGEAVIPKSAAQDPKNKEVIASLVEEGRQGYAKGTTSVPKPGKNRTGIVEYANLLPTIPIVGTRRKLKGYAQGTSHVMSDGSVYTAPDPDKWEPLYPTEKSALSAMNIDKPVQSNPEDTIRRAQVDQASITKELANAKDPGVRSILQAELDKTKATLAMKSPLYDVQVASPDSFTGVNPDSPNRAMRAQGTDAVLQPNGTVTTTNTGINGTTAPGIPPIQTLDQLDDWNRSRGKAPAVPKPRIDALAGMPRNEAGLAGAELQPVIPELPQEVAPEAVNAHFATLAKENEARIGDTATEVKAKVASGEMTPTEGKSFMEDFLSGIFGKDGIINAKTLGRFTLLGAGGLLTGGSVNGSLKYAALDSLKQYDARTERDFAMKKEEAKQLSASRAAVLNDKQKSLHKTVDDLVKDKAFDNDTAIIVRKAIDEGKVTEVTAYLSNPKLSSNQLYNAGIRNDDKPVHITPLGFNKAIKAFRDPEDPQSFIYIDNGKLVRTGGANYSVIQGDHPRTPAEIGEAAGGQLTKAPFESVGGKPAQFSGLDHNAAKAQITEWTLQQHALGHDPDTAQMMNVVNIALNKAAKTGEQTPNLVALLDLAMINTSSLSDDKKLLTDDGKKVVPTSYIGSAVKEVQKAKGKEANAWMTEISGGFTKTQQAKDQLEGLKPGTPVYNAVKSAPNSWWKYVQRKLYEGK